MFATKFFNLKYFQITDDFRTVLLYFFHLILISVLSFGRNFVVGIVGLTSNLEKVSPRIQQLFLHEIKMTPPKYAQRLQMLTAMGRGIPASPGDPHLLNALNQQ